MPNIQVTHDSDLNNARSESSLAIDPNDPLRMVSASKKFTNIHTYDFTLATQYSTDGGHTWHDSAALATPPGFPDMTDPTLAWDDSGNVFLIGLPGKSNPPEWPAYGIVAYKSTDGGKTWSAPKTILQSPNSDKQWVAGDANPGSPHRGNVYVAWDETPPGVGLVFARTKDHGATWIGAGAAAAGTTSVTIGVYPEINVASDGTIYLVSRADDEIALAISTDGGDTFQPSPTPPATNISPLGPGLPILGPYPYQFPVFPGGTFRVLTDPTACAFGDTVTVAWADFRENVSRIYYARSVDRGVTWETGPSGKPLLTATFPSTFQHFHPQIVTDPNGVIGCAFYEFGPKPTTELIDLIMAQSFDGGASFNHFTVTDQPWDPTVDAPWAHGDPTITFIGDYMGLDASTRGFYPLWTDTRTGFQELFVAVVPERRLQVIINRSTIGADEVDALRKLHPPDGIVKDAFRVTVDGYTAAQLGLTAPGSKLNVASPIAGMTITCTGNVSANLNYGSEVQRFTFIYDLDFGSNPADPAFQFATATKTLTVNAAIADVSGSGEIELIKQPNPFILHGDPAWLSIDLRVFAVRANEPKLAATMGPDAAAAPAYIQKVISNFNDGTVSKAVFDDNNILPPSEEASSLWLTPDDDNQKPVFNFALARVRYIGQIGANDVRVFFRLFQAQSTNGAYDYPPGTHYRRATNPSGQPIPLAGIQGNEYVTIPFFAEARKNTTQVGMDTQTDAPNIHHITANADGSEVDTFYGCWLDINQPQIPVIPAQKDALHPDGPFQSLTNPPLPIHASVLKNLHQCLIAEVAFDPITTPIGKDPSNWDKLAQRNLAWSDIGSARAVTTFEIRPTPVGLPAGHPPDELMIDWGATPHGSVATLYLPAVQADEILDLAGRTYSSHRLTRVDDHTIGCAVGGVTYVPVPPGGGSDYAGLLTVDPPANVRPGEQFTVVVRQVTNASSLVRRSKELEAAVEAPKRKGTGKGKRAQASVDEASVSGMGYELTQWRRVLGAFQLTIPVKTKEALLVREERHLSVLRWIAEAIPHDSRWYPVFLRYLDVVGGRVRSFGGNPAHVHPSPLGEPRPPRAPKHEPHHPPGHREHPDENDDREHTGKVAGLIFDRFGDFAGFVLDTKHGPHRYFTRESECERLAERAWRDRLRLTVRSDPDDPDRVASITVWEPPAPFA